MTSNFLCGMLYNILYGSGELDDIIFEDRTQAFYERASVAVFRRFAFMLFSVYAFLLAPFSPGRFYILDQMLQIHPLQTRLTVNLVIVLLCCLFHAINYSFWRCLPYFEPDIAARQEREKYIYYRFCWCLIEGLFEALLWIIVWVAMEDMSGVTVPIGSRPAVTIIHIVLITTTDTVVHTATVTVTAW